MTSTLEIRTSERPQLAPLNLPNRLLLGPGPSNAHPTVLQAMAMNPVGHLDPEFLRVMDEIRSMLRYVWQTENPMTIAVSGTGSAAMEATLANAIHQGETVLIASMGYFGNRLIDMAGRYGAQVKSITKPWGQVFDLAELRQAMETHRPAILALVHAETSTGACQPMAGIGDLCQEMGALLILDTVTSMGGVPTHLDDWGVDLAYSCSQKGLGCSPGASPFTMGDRAWTKLQARTTPVQNWYLDMNLLSKYWGPERIYHHTAPVNLYYGLREALRLLTEEGVENSWKRHATNAEYLWQQLESIGLSMHVDKQYRLPTLTTVRVPEGVDAKVVSARMLKEFDLEIGNGLGELAGKVWRVGLMGHNSCKENVDHLIDVFKQVL
jgi:alanine-glyoxylate transaminase / serine-glyoxylate transaminase / serine-pyruvate transaminase